MENEQIDDQLEDQKQLWVQQQEEIAAAVVVSEDTELSGNDPFLALDVPNIESTLIGGTDISFPITPESSAVAVYTILRGTKVVYCQHVFFQLELPYIPGFLAFREIEPLVKLVREQQTLRPELTPSMILVDGNGTWHERSAGLASALGVRLNLPTIGVGKNFYNLGDWHKGLLEPVICNSLQLALESINDRSDTTADGEFMMFRRSSIDETIASNFDVVSDKKDEWMKALSKARGLAMPLTTNKSSHLAQCCVLLGHGGRSGVRHAAPSAKPIFVSVGHNVSLRQAVAIVCSSCLVRIPEAIRQADLRGREMMRQQQQSSKVS